MSGLPLESLHPLWCQCGCRDRPSLTIQTVPSPHLTHSPAMHCALPLHAHPCPPRTTPSTFPSQPDCQRITALAVAAPSWQSIYLASFATNATHAADRLQGRQTFAFDLHRPARPWGFRIPRSHGVRGVPTLQYMGRAAPAFPTSVAGLEAHETSRTHTIHATATLFWLLSASRCPQSCPASKACCWPTRSPLFRLCLR